MLCDQCGNCKYYDEIESDGGICDNQESDYFEEIVGFDDEICFDYEEIKI
jgi:hypothetical protein